VVLFYLFVHDILSLIITKQKNNYKKKLNPFKYFPYLTIKKHKWVFIKVFKKVFIYIFFFRENLSEAFKNQCY
jgi:hypothetical protein